MANTQTDSFMGARSPARAHVKAAGLLTVTIATLTLLPDSRLHVSLKEMRARPHTHSSYVMRAASLA